MAVSILGVIELKEYWIEAHHNAPFPHVFPAGVRGDRNVHNRRRSTGGSGSGCVLHG